MAKKKAANANKSQAIRDFDKSHPGTKPKQVAEALKKKGITVTPQFVSTIRSVTKRKKGKVGKVGRPRGTSAHRGRSGSHEVSLDSLMRVKLIVDEMGGIDETKSALHALEKLMN